MGLVFRTGRTKAHRGTHLSSRLFESAQGEEICLLVHITSKADEAKKLEQECVTILQHSLVETEGESSQRLDGALKEINGLLKGLTLSGAIEDIHLIVGIIGSEGILHVSHAGRAEAYVIRGGTTTQVTEYMRGKPVPAFVHIASGTLEPRDLLVFSTQRLLRAITPAQLARHAKGGEESLLDEITHDLEAEGEQTSLVICKVPHTSGDKAASAPSQSSRRRRRRSSVLPSSLTALFPVVQKIGQTLLSSSGQALSRLEILPQAQGKVQSFLTDLAHPRRKKRAHLLLGAGILIVLLFVWVGVNLSVSSQRGKTRTELTDLVEQIASDVRTAENRRLAGDLEAANAILDRAEEQSRQVLDNERGLFRVETLDLLDQIRTKMEEINNIVRLSPRVIANLKSKKSEVTAQGFVGISDGELMVFDRQDLFRVLLNSIDDPKRLSDEELILKGSFFDRYKSLVFLLTGNTMMELINSQPVRMKTEDPAGWLAGEDIETYLRYLYMLSPENNQIYKYERLSNRYSAPVEYNVNGDLKGAVDMAIDSNIYVLKKGGQVIKLFRGETRPFTIRRLPDNALIHATRVFKASDGNFYFLDPTNSRVIVTSGERGSGESTYLKQYILEGDQVGELKDLYVDPDESHLILLDEKRVYTVDLQPRS